MSETTVINNIYTKIQSAKKTLAGKCLKKSGKNSYSGFDYYELSDFMPSIIEIFDELKLFSKVTFTDEVATLKIINAEKPEEQEEYTSPMRPLDLKGSNALQALGGCETYQRRYLYLTALDITEGDMFDANSGKKDDSKSDKPVKIEKKENVPSIPTEEQINEYKKLVERVKEYEPKIDEIYMSKYIYGKFKKGDVKILDKGEYEHIINQLKLWINDYRKQAEQKNNISENIPA